ncbi:DUF4158 domain-containing protein [Pseudofrankia sp. BMG5.36]|uniref:DUF4158 domain-containing protein n=1 Tax=Pseudofrankia sp. BMG5.36 TaxID=1834512 RepID=UPI0012FFB5E5|nr:DUF4158 domain-containing protein [Pseudofrankia sp. BMG5.36]
MFGDEQRRVFPPENGQQVGACRCLLHRTDSHSLRCEQVFRHRLAVDYLGSLVQVDPALFAGYSWTGRTIKYQRAQIRGEYGTRGPTEADEERWAQWLAEEICPTETNRERLASALRSRCRSEKVEPPAVGRRSGRPDRGLRLPAV